MSLRYTTKEKRVILMKQQMQHLSRYMKSVIRKNCYKGECPKIEYTAMVWLLKENRLL